MIRTILRQTATFLFTSAAFVALALPAAATPASITVSWGDGTIAAVQSDKELSNVVILDCLGNVTKIESPSTNMFEDADGIVTIWVKSGDNHSGDGPGYGERFDQPMECLEVPSPTTSTTTPSPQPTTTTTSSTPESPTTTLRSQPGPEASPSTSTPTAPESAPTSSPTTLTELPRTGTSSHFLIGVALWLLVIGGIVYLVRRLLD